MKKLFTCLLVGTLMFCMTSFASAEPKKEKKEKPKPEVVFKKLDKDGNGKLSMEEFVGKKKNKEAAEKQFKRRDKDGDSSLSLEEFSAVPKKKKSE